MMSKLKHPHDVSPPSGGDLARLFGLEELRVGRHYLRDADRARIGSLWVQSLWHVEIIPSFHACSALCVIRAEGESLGRFEKTPDWLKAAFATPFQSSVVDIETDPVAPVLNNFELFLPSGNLSLDGIAYKLSFETLELRGSMNFDNPSQPHLIALVSALFSLASEIARRSNVKELGEAVRVWNGYISGRGEHV